MKFVLFREFRPYIFHRIVFELCCATPLCGRNKIHDYNSVHLTIQVGQIVVELIRWLHSALTSVSFFSFL